MLRHVGLRGVDLGLNDDEVAFYDALAANNSAANDMAYDASGALHIAFFDRNPIGRLVTRVTTAVDALNDMFTSGVVSIFEDLFVLAGILGIMLCMNWKLALITLAVLPLIAYATSIFRDKVRDSYRRIRTAIARINAYMQEHVSGRLVLQLFNREKRAFNKFSDINASHMEAFKDAIMAYSVYYPVVEILSAFAIASMIPYASADDKKDVSDEVKRMDSAVGAASRTITS